MPHGLLEIIIITLSAAALFAAVMEVFNMAIRWNRRRKLK